MLYGMKETFRMRESEATTLPEAATGVSHESYDDALDKLCSHGDEHPDDAVLFARGGT